jgi:TPR repeat protein
MFQLAVRFMAGVGGQVNVRAGVKWYRRAAEAGFVGALTVLGNCYAGGRGVEKDAQSAAEWYRLAAAADTSSHESRLCLCCMLPFEAAEVAASLAAARRAKVLQILPCFSRCSIM